MGRRLAVVAILGVCLFERCLSACLNAQTSEGYVVLRDGQRACAPLRMSETIADKGKRYVTCSQGNVFLQLCPGDLRFDTRSGICNWPQTATCETIVHVSGPALVLPTIPPRPLPVPQSGLCSSVNCHLPDCFCFGSRPAVENPPMFIMVSFDGPVSAYWFDVYYRPLVVDNVNHLVNPSGCKSKFAFNVNPIDTDHTKVKLLWEGGNEIGFSFPIPPGVVFSSSYPEACDQLTRIKERILAATGNIALVNSIKGYRAPVFNVAGEEQFDIMYYCNLGYDTSMLSTFFPNRGPQWPFTLDFQVQGCLNLPCPATQYPGLWEVPVNAWVGDDNETCSTPDTCTVGAGRWVATEQQWYDFYRRNFETTFYPTKIPMHIALKDTTFQNHPNAYRALIRCLQDILQTKQDVWLVTPQQVITWMKSQQSNMAMKDQKWGC